MHRLIGRRKMIPSFTFLTMNYRNTYTDRTQILKRNGILVVARLERNGDERGKDVPAVVGRWSALRFEQQKECKCFYGSEMIQCKFNLFKEYFLTTF